MKSSYQHFLPWDLLLPSADPDVHQTPIQRLLQLITVKLLDNFTRITHTKKWLSSEYGTSQFMWAGVFPIHLFNSCVHKTCISVVAMKLHQTMVSQTARPESRQNGLAGCWDRLNWLTPCYWLSPATPSSISRLQQGSLPQTVTHRGQRVGDTLLLWSIAIN